MAYDYIVKVGVDASSIASDILKKIKEADNAKIKIKCDDSDIKKVLSQLSHIDVKTASKLKIDVDGSGVYKTLEQIRKDAGLEVDKINKELSGINIDTLKSELSKAEQELQDVVNKKNRALADYNKINSKDSLKANIDSLYKAMSGSQGVFNSHSQQLMNLVTSYEKAGGKITDFSQSIQTSIQKLSSEGMVGKATVFDSSKFDVEITRLQTKINDFKIEIEKYKNLKQELNEYASVGITGGTPGGKGVGATGDIIDKQSINSLIELLKQISTHIEQIKTEFGKIGNNANFQSMLSSITGINTALESMKTVFVDVGDGEEFSPLFGTINNVISAINELNTVVSNIKLNINIDTSVNEEQTLMKIEGRKQELLRAYQEQFSAMKNHSAGNSKIVSSMFGGKSNSAEISRLNKSILAFDESSYDNIEQKIKAYESMINRMKEVSRLLYGENVYDKMDSNYQKEVTRAKSNLTRAQNSLGKNTADELGSLFGKSDITFDGLSIEVDKIVSKLQEMINMFQSIFGIKMDVDTEGVNAEFVGLLDVLKQIKQAIEAINTVQVKVPIVESTKQDSGQGSSKSTTKTTTKSTNSSTSSTQGTASMDKILIKIKETESALKSFEQYATNNSSFGKIFEEASVKITELNGQLKNGEITLSNYNNQVKDIKNNLEAMKKSDGILNSFSKGMGNDVNLNKVFETASSQVVELNEKLKNGAISVKDYNNEIKLIKTNLDTIKSSSFVLSDFQKHVGSNTQLNSVLAAATSQVAELNGKLQNGTISVKDYNNEIKAIKENLDAIKSSSNILNNFKDFAGDSVNLNKIFDSASSKVAELNNKLQEGRISLTDYNNEIKLIKTNLDAIKSSGNMLTNFKEYIGDSTMLSTAFSNAADKIEQLNTKLNNGAITLDNYNNEVKSVKSSLDAIKNSNVMLDNFKAGIGDNANLNTAFANASSYIGELNTKLQNGSMSLKDYNREVNNVKASLESAKTAVSFVNVNDINAAKTAMQDYAKTVSNNKAVLTETSKNGKALTFEWKDQSGVIQKLTLNYNEMTGAITAVQKASSATSKETKSLSQSFKQGWGNVRQYIMSFMSFYRILAEIKKGITIIRDLDKALTEMRKVSDESLESLKQFQVESFDIAKAVGATAQQIQNSTADWMGEILVPLYGNI